MVIGVLVLQLSLPFCNTLKDKRSQIKPLLVQLHRKFNLSAAEIDHLDHWRSSIIACAIVSNDYGYAQKALQPVLTFIENNFPDLQITEHHIHLD